ncbi:MAG TPA: NDP-sugar synthase [Thermoleophilaceae bacterium]|nr:NDP-sugar synthase [Thermoleophilaceae bacterium]
MQALVLAGGEGTRLRPLTLTTPKPVLPLAGRPFLAFMLDWLHSHGVDEALLSLGYLSDAVHEVLGDIQSGMRLRYMHEDEPLGTAGPVRLAADEGILADRFFVLNGDVLTDMDLTAELAQHEHTGAAGTLALIEVENVASYGVVPTNEAGEVLEFREKQPGPAPTNRINAGAYVLERSVVDLIPAGRAVSFEREVFPQMVGNGLYGWPADGYWIDIGTPERYLESTWDLLAGRVESTLAERDQTGSLVYEGSVTSGAHVGPQSVVGRHCSIGPDTAVERSVLHDRVVVGSDAIIRESIIGAGARIGDRVAMQDAVIGAGAVLENDATLEPGAKVDPGAAAPGQTAAAPNSGEATPEAPGGA